MVRKGSRVQVPERALQKPPQRGGFVVLGLCGVALDDAQGATFGQPAGASGLDRGLCRDLRRVLQLGDEVAARAEGELRALAHLLGDVDNAPALVEKARAEAMPECVRRRVRCSRGAGGSRERPALSGARAVLATVPPRAPGRAHDL